MAKPKKKQTKTRKRNRRAHFRLSAKALAVCEKCGTKIVPHRACSGCGNYKGRSVFEKVYERVTQTVKSVTTKKEKVSSKKIEESSAKKIEA